MLGMDRIRMLSSQYSRNAVYHGIIGLFTNSFSIRKIYNGSRHFISTTILKSHRSSLSLSSSNNAYPPSSVNNKNNINNLNLTEALKKHSATTATITTYTKNKLKMPDQKDTQQKLQQQVDEQAALIRKMKAEFQNAQIINSEVMKLKELRAQLQKIEESTQSTTPKFDRVSLEELLKKRFFFAPSFQIYGGVSGLFDYGPPGCALQANIIDLWRKHFVLEEDMLELDCSILTPHDVLKTSGHVDRFSDLMCKDLKTGDIFRADHLVEGELERRLEHDKMLKMGQPVKGVPKETIRKLSEAERKEYETILAQIDNFNADQLNDIIKKYELKSALGNDLSYPEMFNLMFGTPIGPTGQLKGYLRPETAQGQFLNFKKLLEFNYDRMPFASALIGRSFRNEISPRSGLLRVREFTMAEIEHFVHPDQKDHKRFNEIVEVELNLLPEYIQMEGKTEVVRMKIGDAVKNGLVNNQTLGYFMARIQMFLSKIGINSDKLRFRQHLKNEMAHYACDCWDAEIHTSYGWVECVGCADRSAYDLTKHSESTNEKLVARERLKEPVLVEKTVIEINKKLFGPAFKKNAKVVEQALMGMNEESIKKFEESMKSNGGKCSITASDGESYEITKEMLTISHVSEKLHVREYTPNVIEPSFGIGRILYSLLEHAWWRREEDENRHVLSFPACIAPTKCLLVPLSNNSAFEPVVSQLRKQLRMAGISARVDDSSSSIGKRYSRNDELGTPFAITVDFQTVKDGTVTLRERDSTKQIREQSEVVLNILKELIEETRTWDDVLKQYPEFQQQDLE